MIIILLPTPVLTCFPHHIGSIASSSCGCIQTIHERNEGDKPNINIHFYLCINIFVFMPVFVISSIPRKRSTRSSDPICAQFEAFSFSHLFPRFEHQAWTAGLTGAWQQEVWTGQRLDTRASSIMRIGEHLLCSFASLLRSSWSRETNVGLIRDLRSPHPPCSVPSHSPATARPILWRLISRGGEDATEALNIVLHIDTHLQ